MVRDNGLRHKRARSHKWTLRLHLGERITVEVNISFPCILPDSTDPSSVESCTADRRIVERLHQRIRPHSTPNDLHRVWSRMTRGTQWLANGIIFDRFGPHPHLSEAVGCCQRLRRLYAGPDSGLYALRRRKAQRQHPHIRVAILGAQDEERTPILGSGTAFTAQKRFLANVSAAINQRNETSVIKYQSVLQYTYGKLDLVIGEQLYMCPSDMTLTLFAAHISGYNNEVLVATKDMSPGQNRDLNAEKLTLTSTVSINRPSIPTSK